MSDPRPAGVPAVVLVVDDEAPIRKFLRAGLEGQGYSLVEAATGQDGLTQAATRSPDLVLLDLGLPDIDGFEIVRRIREWSAMPIVVLTARGQEGDKIRALDAGADDYVTKPFSPRELVARVRALLRRRAPEASDEPIEVAGLRLEPQTFRVIAEGQALKMGPTEFRLLHYLMRNLDRVLSRAKLLDGVWGDHVFIEERTVDVHIRRLLLALQPSGHDRLVETVRGGGYRFLPQ
jgi:two-component system phosphate regulon response regulator PhoB